MNIKTELLERSVNFVDSSLCEHARYVNSQKIQNIFQNVYSFFDINIPLFFLLIYLNE